MELTYFFTTFLPAWILAGVLMALWERRMATKLSGEDS